MSSRSEVSVVRISSLAKYASRARLSHELESLQRFSCLIRTGEIGIQFERCF